MDIRRNADRLTLIYTATLSRFGSGPCVRRPSAVQARSHLNTQLPNADTIDFYFWSEKKGGSSAPSEPPLATCLFMKKSKNKSNVQSTMIVIIHHNILQWQPCADHTEWYPKFSESQFWLPLVGSGIKQTLFSFFYSTTVRSDVEERIAKERLA